MLRNRTLLEVLRQTPLKTVTRLAPASTSKVATRNFPLQRQHLLQRRALSSARSSGPTHFSPLSRWRESLFQRTRNIRWNTSKPPTPAIEQTGNNAPQTISGRFKELSRKYGYAAVGVYLGLSVLDFPFCFLTVRLMGPERIGEIEHAVVDAFWSLVSFVIPSMAPEERAENEYAVETEPSGQTSNGNGHKHNESASIWTQLLLAYGVHKSLIFFRVPLTAAVTPKVVKTLRSWGWNIGRPKRVKGPPS